MAVATEREYGLFINGESAEPAGDRGDRRAVEAVVLYALSELRLDRRDCLADVAGLELGELLAVCLDRAGERV